MSSRRLAALVAAVALNGTVTACAAPSPSAPAGKTSPAESAAAPSTQAKATRPRLQTRLRDALLRASDVPGGLFTVDDRGGTNPGGVLSYSKSVVSGDPPTFGPFGVITNADSQRCARLLNALGYGEKAPAADAWAQIDFVSSDGEATLSETVASFPAGRSAEIVSSVATAGSCRTVYSRRANDVSALELKPLAVLQLGNTLAGVKVLETNMDGSISEQVLVVAQVGSNTIQILGWSPGSPSGSVEFDRNLLNQVISKSVARLQAVG